MIGGGAGTHAPGGDAKVNLSTDWAMPGLSGLTGSLRIRFASGGRLYQIDVTSFDSVGAIPGPSSKLGRAQIEARATLSDITVSADNPVPVATNLRLQFRVSDMGGVETANFAAWAENGLLVAASSWDHAFVPETNLVLGKLQVHFK